MTYQAGKVGFSAARMMSGINRATNTRGGRIARAIQAINSSNQQPQTLGWPISQASRGMPNPQQPARYPIPRARFVDLPMTQGSQGQANPTGDNARSLADIVTSRGITSRFSPSFLQGLAGTVKTAHNPAGNTNRGLRRVTAQSLFEQNRAEVASSSLLPALGEHSGDANAPVPDAPPPPQMPVVLSQAQVSMLLHDQIAAALAKMKTSAAVSVPEAAAEVESEGTGQSDNSEQRLIDPKKVEYKQGFQMTPEMLKAAKLAPSSARQSRLLPPAQQQQLEFLEAKQKLRSATVVATAPEQPAPHGELQQKLSSRAMKLQAAAVETSTEQTLRPQERDGNRPQRLSPAQRKMQKARGARAQQAAKASPASSPQFRPKTEK